MVRGGGWVSALVQQGLWVPLSPAPARGCGFPAVDAMLSPMHATCATRASSSRPYCGRIEAARAGVEGGGAQAF